MTDSIEDFGRDNLKDRQIGSCVDRKEGFPNLKDAVNALLQKPPGVVFFDSDYVLRESHKYGLEGNFGKIPDESIDLLTDLTESGWEVAVVSNQPKEGHQIGRLLASKKGHHFFPDSLNELLGKDRVFGSGPLFFLKPFKRIGKGQEEVARFIDQLPADKLENGIYMVGDKDSDGEFLDKVSKEMKVAANVHFLKLPDPWFLARPF